MHVGKRPNVWGYFLCRKHVLKTNATPGFGLGRGSLESIHRHRMKLSERGEIVANPFIHIELNTPDPEKAKTFYSKLFQWQLEDVPNTAVPAGDRNLLVRQAVQMKNKVSGLLME